MQVLRDPAQRGDRNIAAGCAAFQLPRDIGLTDCEIGREVGELAVVLRQPEGPHVVEDSANIATRLDPGVHRDLTGGLQVSQAVEEADDIPTAQRGRIVTDVVSGQPQTLREPVEATDHTAMPMPGLSAAVQR